MRVSSGKDKKVEVQSSYFSQQLVGQTRPNKMMNVANEEHHRCGYKYIMTLSQINPNGP